MGKMDCCKKSYDARVSVLGNDVKYVTVLWQKLTKKDILLKQNIHLEEKVDINNMYIHLNYVESSVDQIRKLNIRHSDGIILVVDADKRNSDEIKNLLNSLINIRVLVLCNTKNMGDTIITNNKEHIKMVACDIEEWKCVNQGLEWLTGCLR